MPGWCGGGSIWCGGAAAGWGDGPYASMELDHAAKGKLDSTWDAVINILA